MEPVDDIFKIAPQESLPEDDPVALVETGNGTPCYLLRENTPLPDLVAALNRISTHVVRHGLWIPQPESATPPRLRRAG